MALAIAITLILLFGVSFISNIIKLLGTFLMVLSGLISGLIIVGPLFIFVESFVVYGIAKFDNQSISYINLLVAILLFGIGFLLSKYSDKLAKPEDDNQEDENKYII